MAFTRKSSLVFILLALCSLAILSLYITAIVLKNQINNIDHPGSYSYGYDPKEVNLSHEVPAAIAFSGLGLIFASSFFILVLVQRANARALTWLTLLLALAWLGILGYQIHNYIEYGRSYWDFLTGCTTVRTDYGYDYRGNFLSIFCGYNRVQFAATIVIGVSVLLLIVLFIMSLVAKSASRAPGPDVSSVPGQPHVWGNSYFVAHEQPYAQTDQLYANVPVSQGTPNQRWA